MYTARVPVHGTYTAVCTARTRPCTRPVHGRVHSLRIRVHHRYKAVYEPYTRPCTRPVHSRIHGPCTRPVHGSVNVRAHGSCTRVVYTARRVHGRKAYRAMYTFPDVTLQTCAARHGRVRGPFTARSRQCIRPCATAVRHVHTSTPQPKRPCTRHVHFRVHGQYTVVYMAGRPRLHGRVHGPRRHVTAVGRVHGRNATCTRSCTRPIHSRVHVRLHGQCTWPRTRTVCRNGPHTTVACRLGTCTWPGRPTCRIHGPDSRCTRPCNGRVHGPLHGHVRAM